MGRTLNIYHRYSKCISQKTHCKSSDLYLLQEKMMQLKIYGDQAFSSCSRCLWNFCLLTSESDTEDSFKKGLMRVLLKETVNV